MATILGIAAKPLAFYREVFLIVLLSLLSSCGLTDACPSCTVPRDTLNEISILGATMTNRSAFYDSIGERYYDINGEPYVYGNISLVFSPKQGIETVEQVGILLNTISRYPYHFTFSEYQNGAHIAIEPGDEINDYNYNDLELYGGHLLISVEFPELEIGGANHTLSTNGFFRAPAQATHVSLWYQESEDSPRELLRRVELNSLSAWKLYFQPLIHEAT